MKKEKQYDILAEITERIVIDYANLSGRESEHRAEFREKVLEYLSNFYIQAIQTQLTSLKEKIEEELSIQKQVQKKAKEILAVGKSAVRIAVEDRDVRKGKIEALSDILEVINK